MLSTETDHTLRSAFVRLSCFLVTLCTVCLLTGCNRLDPSKPPATRMQPQMEQLIEKIDNGDMQAILALGKLGDRTAVPYLKKLYQQLRPDSCFSVRNPKEASERGKREIYETFNCASPNAQMALAKLGEQAQLREILQELASDNARIQNEATYKLAYVGGTEAIQALAGLLDGDNRTRSSRSGHVLYSPLRQLAAYALARMVPDPPVGPEVAFHDMTDEQLELWRKWREEHLE
jgi:hypothetical protein